MANHVNFEHNSYQPSPAEIAKQTAKLRRDWSPQERGRRRGETAEQVKQATGWLPPVVYLADMDGILQFTEE